MDGRLDRRKVGRKEGKKGGRKERRKEERKGQMKEGRKECNERNFMDPSGANMRSFIWVNYDSRGREL